MTASLSAIGPRLAKLLPLLSSDQPGEVVATARAIGLTLKRGGLDWHDLAALVTSAAKRQAAPVFTFANLAPRTARKQIALLAARPTVTLQDRVRLERLRQWLHGQAGSVRLPADQVQWLDGLWRAAFAGG
ncbi:hypothetical protein JMJ56_16865 [Belnapia sp. T18]|uniref:Uncharacterized protein n=1 Tax=Belnapia arida TaxID=2804533 RepID=A0ABS1U4V3_9PROT|nr:hypothetical protein [Belnapia arida]MBL6079692.1 hypothetical protein [Belnapia arida]